MSKGGTLDVGLHTGITKPNTTIEIVKAFIDYLIQEPILSKILLLDRKIFFLK